MSLRDKIKASKRIVVKVGTSSLTYENGNINLTRIEKLARVLSDIANSGKEVVLVSSGAIGVGVCDTMSSLSNKYEDALMQIEELNSQIKEQQSEIQNANDLYNQLPLVQTHPLYYPHLSSPMNHSPLYILS